MRRPQDKVPQRQLVYELGMMIDQLQQLSAEGGSREAAARRALNDVLEANPRSAFSTHVLHNLGSRRRRWLLAYREQLVARGGPLATST